MKLWCAVVNQRQLMHRDIRAKMPWASACLVQITHVSGLPLIFNLQMTFYKYLMVCPKLSYTILNHERLNHTRMHMNRLSIPSLTYETECVWHWHGNIWDVALGCTKRSLSCNTEFGESETIWNLYSLTSLTNIKYLVSDKVSSYIWSISHFQPTPGCYLKAGRGSTTPGS